MNDNSNDFYMIHPSLHLNVFKNEFDFSLPENKNERDNLLVLFDGSIIGVSKKRVTPLLKEAVVKNIRYKFTNTEPLRKAKDEKVHIDDVFRLLASMIPLDEVS